MNNFFFFFHLCTNGNILVINPTSVPVNFSLDKFYFGFYNNNIIMLLN